MSDTLVIDGLTFAIKRSDKRKTVGITVERDGALTISAPSGCPPELVERMAREKSVWVHSKLAEKDVLLHPNQPKEFVSGEGFFYLGRTYRLQLADAPKGGDPFPALTFQQGRFRLRRDERARAAEHFVSWYVEHGMPWIRRRVEILADRVGVPPASVTVEDAGLRWGACDAAGNLRFHWRAVLLPPRIVDYVVVHELVHLLVPHHSVQFWERVARVLPDHEARKQWLAENGSNYA